MPISTFMKPVSMATAGAALMALGIFAAAPASAITFNFQGEFRLDPNVEPNSEPESVEGSYTVADDVIEALLEQPLDPNDPSSFDPEARRVTDVISSIVLTGELTNREATPPTESSITTYLASSAGRFPFATPILEVNVFQYVFTDEVFDIFSFGFEVAGEPDLAQCLVSQCSGFGGYAQPEIPDYRGTISQTPADAQPVPEPVGAIALGVVGASMLVRKRKSSDR